MSSFLSKIIGGLLAVVLLVFIPLVSSACISNLRTERLSWNYLELYTDIISDKGSIQEADYKTFMNNMAATGLAWDIEIEVQQVWATPLNDVSGGDKVSTSYTTVYVWNSGKGNIVTDNANWVSTDSKRIKAGDIVTVTCRPINKTFAQSLVKTLSGMDMSATKITSSKMIRNDGGSLDAG